MTKDEIFQLRISIEATVGQMKSGLSHFIKYSGHLIGLVNQLEKEINEKTASLQARSQTNSEPVKIDGQAINP